MARSNISRHDLKTVRTRIDVAKRYYDQTFRARDILHANLYKGDHGKEFASSLSAGDQITLNYLKRDVNLKVAGLAAGPPSLRFTPRGVSFLPYEVREMLARVWEVYIPYVWTESETFAHLKAVLRDRYVYGRGWCAIDWRTETADTYQEVGDDNTLAPASILYDNPKVTRICPKYVLIDPDVDTLTWEQAGYIAWEMYWPLERLAKWAKGDPRVNSAAIGRIKGTADLDPKYQSSDLPKGDASMKRARIWRYHERERRLVHYIAEELPDTSLLTIDTPYAHEGYPFEPLFGSPVLEKMDATGSVEELRDWQRLHNLIRTKQYSMIKTARHFVWVPPDVSEEAIQALEASDDRIIVQGGAQPAREVNTSGFPPELIQMEPLLRQDLTEVGGITAMRRGLVEQGLDTATESSLLVSQSSVGDREEQFQWEDLARRVVRKQKALIEQFGDAERIAAVSPEVAQGLAPVPNLSPTGGAPLLDVQQGGRYTWVTFTPQQIRDEAEIEVLAGSMGAKEEALERAQFVQGMKAVVDVATQAPALQSIGLNPVEIAKEFFRRFGNTDTSRFFGPVGAPGVPGTPPGGAPDPAATLEKELNALMQSQQGGGIPSTALNRGPRSTLTGQGGT